MGKSFLNSSNVRNTKVSKYHNSFLKKLFNYIFSIVFLFLSIIPCLIILFFIKISSKGATIFQQFRSGKNGNKFIIYKFMTMKLNSENQIKKYQKLNESDGPVFKIKNDPRFTNFGKLLSRTGLDELPQFINVLKGDMSLVGPRPLPVYEYIKLTKKQKVRNLIKPGITSLWVIHGSHNLSFNEWMKLDKKYVEEANLFMDIKIILKTMLIPLKVLIDLIINN